MYTMLIMVTHNNNNKKIKATINNLHQVQVKHKVNILLYHWLKLKVKVYKHKMDSKPHIVVTQQIKEVHQILIKEINQLIQQHLHQTTRVIPNQHHINHHNKATSKSPNHHLNPMFNQQAVNHNKVNKVHRTKIARIRINNINPVNPAHHSNKEVKSKAHLAQISANLQIKILIRRAATTQRNHSKKEQTIKVLKVQITSKLKEMKVIKVMVQI